MNVRELIEYLQKIENKESSVKINISQYNKRSVAVCPIPKPEYDHIDYRELTTGPEVRLHISLPFDNDTYMYTSIRKI